MEKSQSSEFASEAVGNLRIITAFDVQEKILKLCELTEISPKNEIQKQSWDAGLGLYTGQFLTAAIAAVISWYGEKLL